MSSKAASSELTRREFLEKTFLWSLVATSLMVADHGLAPYVPMPTRGFWEALETPLIGVDADVAKRKVQELGISPIGAKEGLAEVSKSGSNVPTIEWDTPSLETLRRFLTVLPKEWLSDFSSGYPSGRVRVALVNEWSLPFAARSDDWSGICYCGGYDDPLVVFDRKSLPTLFLTREAGMRLYFHEFAHVETTMPSKYPGLLNDVVGSLPIKKNGLRGLFSHSIDSKIDSDSEDWALRNIGVSWYGPGASPDVFQETKVEKINGIRVHYPIEQIYTIGRLPFQTVAKTYLASHKVAGVSDLLLGTISGYPEMDYRDQVGYGATNPKEFLAVASEYYSLGWDRFSQAYEPHLGRGLTIGLYENVRKKIFYGKQY